MPSLGGADQPPTPPVVPSPPSADGIVVEASVGMGPFTLGMTAAAARSIGGDARVTAPRTLEIDGLTLGLDGDEPTGTVTSIRVQLARATGGLRIGEAVIANNATYDEIVRVVGPCAAPQVNRGATVTACQGGGLQVIQTGPTLQSITIAVERAAQ